MPLTELEELELLELEELEATGGAPEPTRDGMTREEFSAEFRNPVPESAMQPSEGMMGRIGGDLAERGAEMGRIWGGEYPEQAVASDVLQTAGQVAGGGLDVAGEVVGTSLSAVTPDVIEDPVKRYIGIVGDAASRSPLVQSAIEYGTGLAEEYPETARNLGAIGNMLMVAPAVRPAAKTLKATKEALKKQKPVGLDDIKSAEYEAWDAVKKISEETGTVVKSKPVKQRLDFALKKRAADVDYGKIDADIHPQATALVSKLNERLDVDSLTPDDLQRTRQLFDTYYQRSIVDMKPTQDTRYVTEIKSAFDDIVDGIDAKDLEKGSIAFNKAYKDARKISAVKRKTEVLDDIFKKAELNARNSSFEVALKNGFRQLANNKKRMRQFSQSEQALIRNAAKTGKVESLANKFAVFSPTAGRLGAALTGGAGVGAAVGASNPALLALPAVGFGAEALAARKARQGAQKAFSGVAEQLNPRQSLTERARAAVGAKLSNQKGAVGGGMTRKDRQLEVINKSNPAPNDVNTWIRNTDDIKSFDEVFSNYEGMSPDFSLSDVRNAYKKGKVEVYSSYPIKDGVFVSPSKMEASQYAGEGKLYSKLVDLDDVAWIDEVEGQFAPIKQTIKLSGDSKPVSLKDIKDAGYGHYEATNALLRAQRKKEAPTLKDIMEILNNG